MNKFILFFEPRSGSNLLYYLLMKYVEQPVLKLDYQTTEINVNHSYYIYAEDIKDCQDKLQMLPDHKIIFLSRRDKLKQAISICRLHSLKDPDLWGEKKNYAPEQPEDFTNFSDELLEECILSAVWMYATANSCILQLDHEVLRLYYENHLENLKNWERTLKKILTFLGLDVDPRIDTDSVAKTFKKLSGETSNEIYEAFLSNFDKFRGP